MIAAAPTECQRPRKESAPPTRRSVDEFEALLDGVVDVQGARADVDVPAVQVKPPVADPLANGREGHQILERDEYRALLAGAGLFVLRRVGHGALDPKVGRTDEAHPRQHELAALASLARLREHGTDATAVGVAKHDEVPDLQMLDRVLQRGAGAVILAVPLVGRHQVGDIADDEQVAGIGLQHRGRIDPGIGTGDEGHLGILAPVHKRLVGGALLFESIVAKFLETGGELGNGIHGPTFLQMTLGIGPDGSRTDPRWKSSTARPAPWHGIGRPEGAAVHVDRAGIEWYAQILGPMMA